MSNKSLVLVADDDLVCRKVLEALLRSLNYNFVFATNGRDALNLATTLVPDVALLDVMMPEMDGFEVCRRIRSSPLVAEMPVLMVTALTDKEARLKGLEAGADDFISKPYDQGELSARLKTITRLNRYRRILSSRVQFSWVLERANEGYLMLDDEDAIHYANPAARKLLAIPVGESQQIQGTFMEFAQRQFQFEPAEAWSKWTKGLDAVAVKQARFLSPLTSAKAGISRLQVEMIDFPTGQKASRLVRLVPLEPPKEIKKVEPAKPAAPVIEAKPTPAQKVEEDAPVAAAA
jgi:two-component system cell cycle response regulator